eukprot:scaffold78804_cov54-Phaeocystis_antarctica.AAC.1
MVSHTTRLVCYAIPRCPGPSHPDTKVRDSARPALLTAVRSRLSGLAVHPRRACHTALRPLTGAANTNEGRVSSSAKIDEGLRLGVPHEHVADR